MSSAGPPIQRVATEPDSGRSCPYCRFTFKAGIPLIDCPACHAPHHADCWTDNKGCAVLGCPAAPRDTAGGTAPLPPVTPRSPLLVPPEQTHVAPRAPYTRPHSGPQPGAYTPPPSPAVPPVGSRSPKGLVPAVFAVAGAVAVLVVILLLHNGSGATAGSRTSDSTGTTSAASTTGRISSSAGLTATARGLIGSWHGVVTQYAPSGTQQQIEVRSQISSEGHLLVGQHSETTLHGSGAGQICEGQLRQRDQGGGTISFDYRETLNPAGCILHTVISFAILGSGRVAFQEIYNTKIGSGHLIGQLVR